MRSAVLSSVLLGFVGTSLAGAPVANARGPACSLVPSRLIAGLLGDDVGRSVSEAIPGRREVQCAYFGANASDPLVTVSYVSGMTARAFEASARSSRDHAVSGIGDGAYYFDVDPNGARRLRDEVSLAVLDGTVGFEIDASARLARIEDLARHIAALIRT